MPAGLRQPVLMVMYLPSVLPDLIFMSPPWLLQYVKKYAALNSLGWQPNITLVQIPTVASVAAGPP